MVPGYGDDHGYGKNNCIQNGNNQPGNQQLPLEIQRSHHGHAGQRSVGQMEDDGVAEEVVLSWEWEKSKLNSITRFDHHSPDLFSPNKY